MGIFAPILEAVVGQKEARGSNASKSISKKFSYKESNKHQILPDILVTFVSSYCMHILFLTKIRRHSFFTYKESWSSTSLQFIQPFLASQDALEVMRVTDWVTYLLTERSHWLYWCDPGEWWYLWKTLLVWSWLLWWPWWPWWKLSSDESCLVMKVI